jgi:carbon monoxide dehydrogenase subunit G
VKFTYSIPFHRPAAEAWQAVCDAERLIRCIPGCEAVERAAASAGEAEEGGVEVYRVRMTTSLGPVRLGGAGTARVRKDPARRSMRADVSLSDPGAGSAYGTMALEVRAIDEHQSELQVEADVVLAGKIGEFAQPILRRKADQTVRKFAKTLIEAAGRE